MAKIKDFIAEMEVKYKCRPEIYQQLRDLLLGAENLPEDKKMKILQQAEESYRSLSEQQGIVDSAKASLYRVYSNINRMFDAAQCFAKEASKLISAVGEIASDTGKLEQSVNELNNAVANLDEINQKHGQLVEDVRIQAASLEVLLKPKKDKSLN